MKKKTTSVGKEIERLVSKYSLLDSKEVFRVELKYLVLLAEREQMKADHKVTMRMLKQK